MLKIVNLYFTISPTPKGQKFIYERSSSRRPMDNGTIKDEYEGYKLKVISIVIFLVKLV